MNELSNIIGTHISLRELLNDLKERIETVEESAGTDNLIDYGYDELGLGD